MSVLKLSLLQQPLTWMDGAANLRHFTRQLDGLEGRDLIVLPEMFTSGFAMQAASHSMPEQEVTDWMLASACRCNAMIAASAALQTASGPVNRFLLVQPDGVVHHYDKRHLFRMAGEDEYYRAGSQRIIVNWRGWRILPQICYDLRFPVWSRNHNDYDLALYVANWPAPRSFHWQTLLSARAIENQAWVAGCNRVGTDGNGLHYRGDSRIISPQGEVVAEAPPHQAAHISADLSHTALNEYRENFPAWRDADTFTLSP
ncbi:amidohydrolase [Shimwellia blattae]|uniref:Omega-amidase YafV n=1 Tax=Shimwellia blattae (strain ATCC 29907 / DSM 4481 / JCM 1650 / NBRC 105725 / CDC 9005-74) TaxID=630626 RepID=I2BCF2_SHIBC|nr:amidohydrolase [Shimwellia blattae]AFJ48206.1 putative nitrilase/cyanide hydratase and apolipoprotein N-acyltransferase [Shimwellia blattae DSM 4481 = NBRC 105725]GAB82765.1 putative hydrolase YafV [Shimwellia blattae DSM 4481 = NBRC 105725]VDY65702.1 (R)-stereoselective amidase [Shimwellia blattae]VEC25435.1 (R)-stereoselective amidase [Shimwellia blattae]